MLTSFGLFWVGEGAGVEWPGGDLVIPVLVAFFVVVTVASRFMKTTSRAGAAPSARRPDEVVVRGVEAFGRFWWDFLVGDTPELALATGVIVALAFLIDGERLVGVILLPVLAAAFLLVSTLHGRRRVPGR